MKRLVFLLGFCCILWVMCGCKEQQNWAMTHALQNYHVTDQRDIYPVYFESNRSEFMPFEPSSGCMVGANILQDAMVSGDILQFEEATKKSHEIYACSMKLGENFPLVWALECFTQDKIPMVTIYPEDFAHPFDVSAMMDTAQKVGKFQVPVFLEFFPNPPELGTPEQYLHFFRLAREVFRKEAPNAVFVWSMPLENVSQAEQYYPGDENVDWIGVNVVEKSGEQGDLVQERFLQWYYTFQKRKPLMISQLKISHFSTENSAYTEQAAVEEILRFYAMLPWYPAVKAVVYGDENPSNGSYHKTIRENYLLTDSDAMLSAYEQAVSAPWFSPKEDTHWERSPFVGYVFQKRLYVQQKTVDYDLDVEKSRPNCKINGDICCYLGDISEYRTKLWENCLWLEKKEVLWK